MRKMPPLPDRVFLTRVQAFQGVFCAFELGALGSGIYVGYVGSDV